MTRGLADVGLAYILYSKLNAIQRSSTGFLYSQKGKRWRWKLKQAW